MQLGHTLNVLCREYYGIPEFVGVNVPEALSP